MTKLAFNGENITYSGVVGLVGQKDYLKSLSIKFEYSEMATKFEKQCPNFIWNYKFIIIMSIKLGGFLRFSGFLRMNEL